MYSIFWLHLTGRLHLEVPFARDQDYISVLANFCTENNIDLIIPSNESEVSILSINQNRLPSIISSEPKTLEIFGDKYLTYKLFSEASIPFADSYLPSEKKNIDFPFILKPRKGYGSKNIYFNPTNIDDFGDDYIIQRLYEGTELTIGFYVTKANILHGFMALSKFGSPPANAYSVYTQHQDEISDILKKIVDTIPIKGPCNLQCIVTENDEIIPFEVNCRLSGSSSIRHHFGFRDIEYILCEYLWSKELPQPELTEGCALRGFKDIIFPNISTLEDLSSTTKYISF
ncbi:ATP-grasp domain-containing protein [Saprospira grandis]|uniref:Carbamoyl phosphate synthase-like protein n=1 Tax=Saprospira grandis (strain Lewin) TaxID=984262 RepID=H6L1Z9_SAPGL|nr:ATP-grasp domain-containing protein [Saprospira grandis]AFC23536.1 carbamoyl phosphate synthase-like protein [Saprospira grandis str. Lewin]